MAAAVTCVEEFEIVDGIITVDSKKLMKNNGCSNQSLVRFFKRRVCCSCLDEPYLRVMERLKIGKCFYCCEMFEVTKLLVCGDCKMAQYCSKECQRKEWYCHKKLCTVDNKIMII